MPDNRNILGCLLYIFALVGTFNAIQGQTSSCTIDWSPKIRLSNDEVPSNLGKIALQGDTIHVVWFGLDTLSGLYSVQYTRSTDGGRNFSAQHTLIQPENVLGPALITASDSIVVVACYAAIDTSYGTAVIRSPDAGRTWFPPRLVLANVQPKVITSLDSIFYLHYQSPLNNRLGGLLRSTDRGLTWSVRNTLIRVDDMVASPKRLHAITTPDAIRKEVEYRFSVNGGANWGGPEVLSVEDQANSTLPSIAVNERGEVFAVWNDTGTIAVRISNNGGISWRPQQILMAQKGAVFSEIGAAAEFVAVVWDNDFGGSGGLRMSFSNDLGATYCAVDTPTSSGKAGEPSLAVTGSTIHLVWSEEIDTQAEIFYRRGTLKENPDAITKPPRELLLRQNYPNPCNGNTVVRYELPAPAVVTLSLYDVLGRSVRVVEEGFKEPGRYSMQLDITDLPTGMYFMRLRAREERQTRKLLIIR